MSCVQLDIFKRERFFELNNEKYLRVISKNRKGTTEFTIALISLLPESSRVVNVPWRWLMLALVFFLVSVGAMNYLAQHFNLENALYLVPVCLIAISLTAGSVYLLIYNTERNQVFYTAYGDFPLVELMIGKPDKKQFEDFVEELRTKINKEMESNTISAKNLQAGEMKMLRRLMSQGILSQNEYVQAKNRIFKFIDSQDIEQGSIVDKLTH